MKTVDWRVNDRTASKFWALVGEMSKVQEDSEEYEMLLDEVKSLPGFPRVRLVGRGAPVVNVIHTEVRH